jgi:hypothetical protein
MGSVYIFIIINARGIKFRYYFRQMKCKKSTENVNRNGYALTRTKQHRHTNDTVYVLSIRFDVHRKCNPSLSSRDFSTTIWSIWGFRGGGYEQSRLVGCYAMWHL